MRQALVKGISAKERRDEGHFHENVRVGGRCTPDPRATCIIPWNFCELWLVVRHSMGMQVRNMGHVWQQRLTPRNIQRGLRRHPMVFQGKEAVETLVASGVAKDVTDALTIGNAFLRECKTLFPRSPQP